MKEEHSRLVKENYTYRGETVKKELEFVDLGDVIEQELEDPEFEHAYEKEKERIRELNIELNRE